jgi:hypothetical protein
MYPDIIRVIRIIREQAGIERAYVSSYYMCPHIMRVIRIIREQACIERAAALHHAIVIYLYL